MFDCQAFAFFILTYRMDKRLFETLKDKCSDMGLSVKSLEEIAEMGSNGLTEESTQEQIEEAVNRSLPIAKLMQAEATRWAAARKSQNTSKEQDGRKNKADEMPDWFKTYQQQQKEERENLLAEIEKLKGGKVEEFRTNQVNTVLANAKPSFKERVLRDFKRMKFDADEDFTVYLEELKNDLETYEQEEANREANRSYKPVFGERKNKEDVSPALQQRINNRNKATRSAISGI